MSVIQKRRRWDRESKFFNHGWKIIWKTQLYKIYFLRFQMIVFEISICFYTNSLFDFVFDFCKFCFRNFVQPSITKPGRVGISFKEFSFLKMRVGIVAWSPSMRCAGPTFFKFLKRKLWTKYLQEMMKNKKIQKF